MRVTNIVNIDLANKQNITFVDAVQGDSARAIEFHLFDKGQPFAIPENALVLIRYKRPDGAGGVYDTLPNGEKAFLVDRNKVTIGVADVALAVAGTMPLQIAISENGDLVSAFIVTLRVEADPSAEAVTPEDYVNIQRWMDAEVDRLKDEFEERFNAKAEELETLYSYVAEDPNNDGNVILRPFNLGGITDVTLTKHDVAADAYETGLQLSKLRSKSAEFEEEFVGMHETFTDVANQIWDIRDELEQKAPASGSPNYSLGMVREFEANPNSESYTTQGTLSRFYNVTVSLGGVRVLTITIDRRMLRLSDQGYDVVAAFTSDGFIYVSSVINSDNTVTFTANSVGTDYTVKILHICGYY